MTRRLKLSRWWWPGHPVACWDLNVLASSWSQRPLLLTSETYFRSSRLYIRLTRACSWQGFYALNSKLQAGTKAVSRELLSVYIIKQIAWNWENLKCYWNCGSVTRSIRCLTLIRERRNSRTKRTTHVIVIIALIKTHTCFRGLLQGTLRNAKHVAGFKPSKLHTGALRNVTSHK